MNKNILIVTATYFPDLGGAGIVAKNTSEELLKSGYKVTIFCGGKTDKTEEMNGVKVVEVETPNYFSGMSTMVNDIAVIVINSDMNSVRKRLTALHELAHIILTFPKGMDDEEIEDICFYFAAAFLVPAEVIFNDLGIRRTNLLLDEVIKFENYYGISVQAFVRRIFNLGIISESKFNSFKHWLNRTEMKDAEIGSFWSLESPSRLRELVIKALSLEIITESKAASLLDIPLSQLIDERTEII